MQHPLFKLPVLLVLALPLSSVAQTNKSAYRLADENISRYLSSKVFIGQKVHSVDYGPFKAESESSSTLAWSVRHTVSVMEPYPNKDSLQVRIYHFTFYLDKKMQVLSARGGQQVTPARLEH
jgi:hypothetical protein